MTTQKEALKLPQEQHFYYAADDTRPVRKPLPLYTAEQMREYAQAAIKEALAQPEQPKVRTGNCLLVGVCASEGHKIQKAQPEQKPDYAWPTIEDYENEVGFSVGDAFKMGWSMARTTNDLFVQMVEQS